ncbi:MAG: hypothetical protein CMA63_08285 [Euryarchaeota archaeon]|nr:hypothetical protein [Euryarchaeota archaeon]|tara:strand:+ start:23153 stop:24250 length:1098 start_codon:yes stop_codon:yes gene_type:complete
MTGPTFKPTLSKIAQSFLLVFFVASAGLSGCLSNPVSFEKCEDDSNCLTIAFEAKEEYRNSDENPQKLADHLSDILGKEVEIYPVSSPAATIEALRFGHADIGFLDGGAAWLSWQLYGLEVLGAEQKADGRPFYNAIAWVHQDSDMAMADKDGDNSTDPFELMAGKTSCHTSALGSSGMLLPMGYMITNGYIEVVGDPNEIDSLHDTVTGHFSEDSSIPESGGKYYRYIGSLRCLAEGGMDYISFAKDPTVPSYCGNEDSNDNEDWCFTGDFQTIDDYYALPTFGKAPSHPIMFNPDFLDTTNVTALQDALAQMSQSDSGLDVLDDVLSTPGITIVNTTDHLGNYGTLIEGVPGIQAYFSDKYDL